MFKEKLTGSLLLLVTALIWAVAFVAQSVGMAYIEPFTFSAARSLIGALALLPFVLLIKKNKKTDLRKTLIAALCADSLFLSQPIFSR
jgi:drug/metabolite transporter (DMT)-like permease